MRCALPQLITSLDKDGNGLNKEEFVLGMLKALEIISDEDTRDFEKQVGLFQTVSQHRFARLCATHESVVARARACAYAQPYPQPQARTYSYNHAHASAPVHA
eukprot:5775836-Pleurochrysis_carterae.AAC.2